MSASTFERFYIGAFGAKTCMQRAFPGLAHVRVCRTKPWQSPLRRVTTFTESVPLHVRTNGGPHQLHREDGEEEEGESERWEKDEEWIKTGVGLKGGAMGGERARKWRRGSLSEAEGEDKL